MYCQRSLRHKLIMYSCFVTKKIKKIGMYDIFLFQRECKLAKLERDKSNKYDNEVLKMSICIRYMQGTFHMHHCLPKLWYSLLERNILNKYDYEASKHLNLHNIHASNMPYMFILSH